MQGDQNSMKKVKGRRGKKKKKPRETTRWKSRTAICGACGGRSRNEWYKYYNFFYFFLIFLSFLGLFFHSSILKALDAPLYCPKAVPFVSCVRFKALEDDAITMAPPAFASTMPGSHFKYY